MNERRRAMMGVKKGESIVYPDGFVPVEYLQSVAYQCRLDTGVVPSISKKFIVDGLVATDENVTHVLFESTYSWSTGEQVKVHLNGIWNWARLSFSDANHLREGINNTKSRHIYEIDANGSYIDGVMWSWTPSKSFEGYNSTVNLFCDTAVRIYNFKVEDNGVLTMNLVPGRINQVGCMYDTVSGQVFYNNSSGSFTLGPDI